MKRHRYPEIDRTIGYNLRSHRRKAGLSMKKIGAELGISYQQWQKYEKGDNRISAALLRVISDLLQVPIDDFYKGIPRKEPLAQCTQYASRAMEQLCVEVAKRRLAIKMLETLAGREEE